ncbi:protein NRT1/ PTR FAMILY 7.3-like [Magnolia sinica]|uniref:protein NRT1/ PTR FAMILY 7.3-like n=1 Tax=Magnolia sinica TaxID=86752 RepID=UPI00265A05AF|nr:protein NRT1/ PTR FAMILY 7.3-like [Magnolia sinica]
MLEDHLSASTSDSMVEKGCAHEKDDDEAYTQDGSMDRHGQPSIKGKTGGWGIGILLLVNQGLATLAFFGVGVNLVLFLTKVLKQDNAQAANNVSKWTGTTYAFSLVGAFASDSCWGRYKTCAIFQVIFVLGLVLLSLSSYLFLLRPCIPGDGDPQCVPPTAIEIAVFYLCIYQIALGNGGYQPSITTFGADQFDDEDPKEGLSKVAFFSYFYLAMNLGSLISNTALVYVEDEGKWVLGFWTSAGAAFVALVLFLGGTPRYRHFKPGGNPLPRVCQVAVAAVKKWTVEMPPCGEDLYEVDGKEYVINGSRRILHTQQFRFLDRAAVITTKDFSLQDQALAPDPWCLCTITQVEEVKCILRLIPIWLCTIIYSVVYTQMASVFVEQGATMKTAISTFHIPPASMSIFEILGVACFVLLNKPYIVPLFCQLQKTNLRAPAELQRMGVGLIISAMAMVSAGIVELQRLKYADVGCNDCEDASSLSILWQIPQYLLVGASEVFMYVGQLEFFNRQAPVGLKSFGSALCMTSMSLGNYVSSLLVTIVMDITTRDDQPGWIPENLNKGHMERFYFLLAALTGIDFIVYMLCAKWYKCISFEGKCGAREVSHDTNSLKESSSGLVGE